MLREIPSGAEEEAEEAVGNRRPEVNTQPSRWEVAVHVTFPELTIIYDSIVCFYVIGMLRLGRNTPAFVF